MQVTKSKESSYVFNPDRELRFDGDKIIFKGIDVTPISTRIKDDFVSVMGKVGQKSFHHYFGLDKNGKWYKMTGVTSALDYVGDKSNLMQWYANQVVEQFGWSKQLPDETAAQYNDRLALDISKKLELFNTLTVEEKIEFIKKARTAASQYGRKTANLGKAVHEEIEMLIKDAIKNNEGRLEKAISQNEQVKHFINWAQTNKVVFKRSEFPVYNKEYWYAGTLDLVIEIDGALYLGDIKTTSSVFGRTYFAQCAAYRLALEEMYPGKYQVAGSIIVRIGRDGLFNPEEDVYFSSTYEDDKKFFLAGLEIYRQENNLFAMVKE